MSNRTVRELLIVLLAVMALVWALSGCEDIEDPQPRDPTPSPVRTLDGPL